MNDPKKFHGEIVLRRWAENWVLKYQYHLESKKYFPVVEIDATLAPQTYFPPGKERYELL